MLRYEYDRHEQLAKCGNCYFYCYTVGYKDSHGTQDVNIRYETKNYSHHMSVFLLLGGIPYANSINKYGMRGKNTMLSKYPVRKVKVNVPF